MNELGKPLTTFRFGATRRRRLTIPLLAAGVAALAVPMVLISLTQAFGIIPVGREMANVRVSLSTIAAVISAPIAFVVVGLPAWLQRPLVLDVYENGLAQGGARWLWTQLDALTVVRANETLCQLHRDHQVVCCVATSDPQINTLIQLLIEKTHAAFLPRLTQVYQSGREVAFGGLSLSRNGLRQGDSFAPAGELAACEVDGISFIFRRKDGTAALYQIAAGLPNAHLLPSLLALAEIPIQQ